MGAFNTQCFCRYCNSGKKRCPVSGGPLKVSKGGKVLHTVDFALRKLIITQSAHAKVPTNLSSYFHKLSYTKDSMPNVMS